MVTFVHLIDVIQMSKQKFMICKFCTIGTQSDMLLSTPHHPHSPPTQTTYVNPNSVAERNVVQW